MDGRVLLKFEEVGRTFHTPRRGTVHALRDVDLDCHEGRITCIVGSSGCGKTTLLRIAAGLDTPTNGRVHYPAWGSVQGLPVALVTQEGNLLPWRNVLSNITLPMRLRGASRRASRRRAFELLAGMHLDDSVAFSYPHELSGGMRRRAAVATAMACDPDLLMMDEPFNGIDESTRERLCQQVLDLRLHAGQSILLVTHAIEEALLLGDAIVILGETPGAQRLEIDLSHPRDCLSREFETQLLRIRRLLAEQSA